MVIASTDQLEAGSYLILDPVHLECEELDGLIGEVRGSGKFLTYRHHTLFAFPTAYGASRSNLYIAGKPVGTIDSDYGTLVVIPMALIHELSNPYTEWFIANTYNLFVGGFKIEKNCLASYQLGVLTIGEVMLDTKDLYFEDEEDRKSKEELINSLGQDQVLSRNMTTYVTFHTMFHSQPPVPS